MSRHSGEEIQVGAAEAAAGVGEVLAEVLAVEQVRMIYMLFNTLYIVEISYMAQRQR